MKTVTLVTFALQAGLGLGLSMRDHLLARNQQENLDILIPDGMGNLTRIADLPETHRVFRRQTNPDKPGTVTYTGSGDIKFPDRMHTGGTSYGTIMTQVISGDQRIVSDPIDCTVDSCPQSHASSVAITEGWSLTATITGSKTKLFTDAITGGASLGATYSWSKTTTTTNTYGFNPKEGDNGHIAFVPYLLFTCGLSMDSVSPECASTQPNQPVSVDALSCGTSGMTLSSGESWGQYSFCNEDGKGCGSH